MGFLAQANILMEKMKLTNLNPESRVKQCHRMELKIQVFNSSRYPRTSKMHSHTEELRNYTGDICYGEIDIYIYIYIYYSRQLSRSRGEAIQNNKRKGC